MLSEPLLIDRNLSWRAWFRSAGLKLDRDITGTSFTDTNALMEAAVTGQGIALGRLSFTRSDILAGKLVRLSEHSLRVAYLLPLCRLPDLFGVQPSPGGFPGLAG
jgi:LysR family glycine cleavage system transcriptional activator